VDDDLSEVDDVYALRVRPHRQIKEIRTGTGGVFGFASHSRRRPGRCRLIAWGLPGKHEVPIFVTGVADRAVLWQLERPTADCGLDELLEQVGGSEIVLLEPAEAVQDSCSEH